MRVHQQLFSLFFTLAVLWPMVMIAETADLVTVTPRETDEILANPGMGWETFHHTANQDRSLPDWIPSTVHYARWGWGQIEPQPGKIDYQFLDQTLKETRESGQKLAFRVMCCSTSRGRPYHPNWLTQVGGRELVCTYDKVAGYRVPDLDHPETLKRHLDFLHRLGERYDGHPDID
ncbi:MAG: beta-galactosidase, partial [Thermoguttaceae bacterium]|nr:beta-galactosidase [Thermoguttaceae bacterium]